MSKTVLMVCDSLGGGGAERQLSLLVRSLPAAWEPHVFSLGGGRFAEELRESGVNLHVKNRQSKMDIAPWIAMWKYLAEIRPDVVHSWGWMSSWCAEPCCRLLGIPHVSGVIRRGNLPQHRGWPLQTASRLGRLAIANSQAGLDAFEVPSDRGRVLYNGFAEDRLAGFVSSEPEVGAFKIVMAATMDARKDFAIFLGAARDLQASDSGPCSFVALGDGPDYQPLSDEYADLVETGIVSMPGRVSEVLSHYQGASVGVMLSTAIHGEGLSNSIMECMAAGLPVICTDQGGNPELVVEGETGFLVPVGDQVALVAKLQILKDDSALAMRMGQAGKARIKNEFSVARMVSRAAEIYSEVCR